MSEMIKCPNCGTEIQISEAIAARVRAELEASLRQENDQRLKQAVQEAEARSREQSSVELKLLQDQLAEQQRKVRQAQAAELALRKEKAALEERQRELDLEVARRLDAEKQRLEESIRKTVSEEQSLKVREKDKQIEDLKKLLEEAKRKSEQGSQELQGEVLELDIEAVLTARFPQDIIRPVPKGVRGADIIQEVRNAALQPCGTIIWEMKNTKHWQPSWIAKLKDDQRATGASLAVLVSVVLPEDIRAFGCTDVVWVSDLASYLPLSMALREQLIHVAFARNAATGMNDKMEAIYRYLSGDTFRQKVEAIVEAFAAMREQIDRERRAMTRHWAEREKQLERVIANTAGMYGDLRGTIGQVMQPIAALELDATPLLEEVK